MVDAEVRDVLDRMGITWDDPVRQAAEDFSARPLEEKLLYLFVLAYKPRKSLLSTITTGAAGGSVVLLGVLAQRFDWANVILNSLTNTHGGN